MTPTSRLHRPATAPAALCLAPCVALAATLALALPAAAQDNMAIPPAPAATGACGQPASLTHRVVQPLDLAPLPAPVAVRLDRLEPAYVEFVVATPSQVTLQTGSPEQVDTFLALFDTSAGVIDWNDDSAGNLHARLSDIPLAPGLYCAQVRIFGWESAGNALATLSLAATSSGTPAAPTAPSTAANADMACGDPALLASLGTLAPGAAPASGTAQIGRDSRRDWAFSLAAPMVLTLEALGIDGFDPILALHDATGQMLAENDDRPQGGYDSEIVIDLGPGDYCASVRGWAGSDGGVTFVATEGAPGPGGSTLPASDGPCGNPVRTEYFPSAVWSEMPGTQFRGFVEPGTHTDWLMEVDDQTVLQLNARSTEFDTVLELYTLDGWLVAENDDAPGQGTDSEIVATLGGGDYCIRVRGFAGSGGGLELAAEVRGGAPSAPSAPAPGGLATPDIPALPGPGETVTALGTITDSAEASLGTDTLFEWFSFTLPADGPADIRALALGGPFWVWLLTADDVVMASDYSTGGMDIARMQMQLPAGEYFAVIHWDGPAQYGVRQLAVSRP